MKKRSNENDTANKKAQPGKDETAKPDANQKNGCAKVATTTTKDSQQGWAMKGILLVTLSVQHSLVGLITRQSRTTGTGLFLPQTGVICQEILKGVVSLLLVVSSGESVIKIFSNPLELARASVPALLYLVNNNLQYIALGYLNPATYVVTYQLKILSTGLMSVLLLKRVLSLQKWLALVLLVLGVSVVQLSEMHTSASTDAHAYSEQLIGLAAVLTTCVISGIAGVYTEMMLKSSSVTLWARNVQLALFSIIIGVVGLAVTDDLDKVRSGGFFQGYNSWACASIVNNSFGGLLIAVIIKYADNIVKNFATAFSIVLATAGSIHALGLTFSPTFLAGVAIVCCSTFLYGGAFDDLMKLFTKKKPAEKQKEEKKEQKPKEDKDK